MKNAELKKTPDGVSALIVHSYFCILTSAFLLLHSYFCILHSDFCIIHSDFGIPSTGLWSILRSRVSIFLSRNGNHDPTSG
jgi:hypothetical protein